MTVVHGYVLLRRGTVDEAVLVREPAVKTCREKNFAGQLIPALTILGHAYALGGHPTEGIPLIKEAVTRHEKLGATAQEALGFAAHHGEHWVEGWTKTILAEVASRRSDVLRSAQLVAEARQIATELGMRPLAAHCHASLAKLYRGTGKRAESDEHFEIATTMYREMGMTDWLEKAEAEMKEQRYGS
jgi:hypothetical protein